MRFTYVPALVCGAAVRLTAAAVVEGKLNVHLIPHTHTDVGWLETVSDLYGTLQTILDSVVAALNADPARRFVFSEIAFFEHWLTGRPPEVRAQVVELVQSGRLELLNGGWVSNDEASCTFVDIIDQHALGATYIARELGPKANPTVGWQLDPFGHSLFQAKAYSQMGMDSWFFARTDRQDFMVRQAAHSLETIHSGILTGTLDHYSAPEGLNYGKLRGSRPVWNDAKVDSFVSMCQSKAEGYNYPGEATQHVMITMGDDFEYKDANTWFVNMDAMIAALNNDGRINVLYSTPKLYVASRARQERAWTQRSDYDWFPYCDSTQTFLDPTSGKVAKADGHSQWTGYFTSRPGLKRQVREASTVLEACRLAELVSTIPTPNARNPPAVLWEALSVAQHHDAITGTARARVARDYARILQEGIDGCKSFISASVLDSSNTGTRDSWVYQSMLSGPPVPVVDAGMESAINSPPVRAYMAYYKSSDGNTPERKGQKSGPYIFRPDCPEGDVAPCRPTPVPAEWNWVKLTQFADRVEWEVGPIPSQGAGLEIVLVIESDVDNEGVFFTDSNAFQWIERNVNHRPTWEYLVTDPVAGNYYPITAGIAIVDANSALVVTPDRSVGGSSLVNGQIEIMIHRWPMYDDGRGIAESDVLKDVNAIGIEVSVKGTTLFSLHDTNGVTTAPPVPVSWDQLRPRVMLGEASIAEIARLAIVNASVGVQVMQVHRVDVPTFCVLNGSQDCILVRLVNPDGSPGSVAVDLSTILAHREVVAMTETALNAGLTIEDAAERKVNWVVGSEATASNLELPRMIVNLDVGQMRTFILAVKLQPPAPGDPQYPSPFEL